MRLWACISRRSLSTALSQDVVQNVEAWPASWSNGLFDESGINDGMTCFAGGLHAGNELSLITFIKYLNLLDIERHNNIYKNWWTGEYVIIELEVPESELRAVKYLYVTEDGAATTAQFLPEGQSFKGMLRRHGDLGKAPRNPLDGFLVLINCIRRDWLVCYRHVASVYEGANAFVGSYIAGGEIATEVIDQNKFPTFIGNFGLYKEDIRRFKESMKANTKFPVKGDPGFCNDLLVKRMLQGMNGCPRYFTVTEAIACCNSDTLRRINDRLKELGMEKCKPGTTIRDLFPDGLLPA